MRTMRKATWQEAALRLRVHPVTPAPVVAPSVEISWKQVIWSAIGLAVANRCAFALLSAISASRAAQAVEFILFCLFLTVVMVAYKKLHGIKVVW